MYGSLYEHVKGKSSCHVIFGKVHFGDRSLDSFHLDHFQRTYSFIGSDRFEESAKSNVVGYIELHHKRNCHF